MLKIRTMYFTIFTDFYSLVTSLKISWVAPADLVAGLAPAQVPDLPTCPPDEALRDPFGRRNRCDCQTGLETRIPGEVRVRSSTQIIPNTFFPEIARSQIAVPGGALPGGQLAERST